MISYEFDCTLFFRVITHFPMTIYTCTVVHSILIYYVTATIWIRELSRGTASDCQFRETETIRQENEARLASRCFSTAKELSTRQEKRSIKTRG